MNELKATSSGEIRGRNALLGYWWYEKSETDTVIAELKDKCQMHDFFWEGCGFATRGFKNSIAVSEAFDNLEAENRHQKYKRCLAMALLWRERAETSTDLDNTLISNKRYEKWLAIAEKIQIINLPCQRVFCHEVEVTCICDEQTRGRSCTAT